MSNLPLSKRRTPESARLSLTMQLIKAYIRQTEARKLTFECFLAGHVYGPDGLAAYRPTAKSVPEKGLMVYDNSSYVLRDFRLQGTWMFWAIGIGGLSDFDLREVIRVMLATVLRLKDCVWIDDAELTGIAKSTLVDL